MVNTPNAIHRVAVKVMTNGRHHRKSTPSFLQGMCASQMAHALRLPVSRETATVSAAVKVERGAVCTGPDRETSTQRPNAPWQRTVTQNTNSMSRRQINVPGLARDEQSTCSVPARHHLLGALDLPVAVDLVLPLLIVDLEP